jgi:hypothetical protein
MMRWAVFRTVRAAKIRAIWVEADCPDGGMPR